MKNLKGMILMSVLGIVAEYNPFHNGHKYHIDKSKEITRCDFVVAVMSGSFVQRGEPAIVDKWSRALMAVHGGIDLVIELPVYHSLQSAELFGYYSIKALSSTGIVNSLSFGSETGNINELDKIAESFINESFEFKSILKKSLKKGLNYPAAREVALKHTYPDIYLKKASNDILAIEYLKALKKIKSDIIPYTINRIGSEYNDVFLRGSLSSATSIRKHILTLGLDKEIAQRVPPSTSEILKGVFDGGIKPVSIEDYFGYFRYVLTVTPKEYLSDFFDMESGLENRFYSEIHFSNNFDEFLSRVKTKRYTFTRLSRIVSRILLNFKGNPLPLSYLRVLAFNKKGQELLREMKKKATVPVIIKPSLLRGNKAFSLEIKGTNLFYLHNFVINKDFTNGPVIIE
jgi:predicted nucleotidyltransferase